MADEIATIISSLGLSNEAFLAIVLLAFVVIGAIIVIVATRPILDVYPYLHPNARVRARKGRLFDEKQCKNHSLLRSAYRSVYFLILLPSRTEKGRREKIQ